MESESVSPFTVESGRESVAHSGEFISRLIPVEAKFALPKNDSTLGKRKRAANKK
jgi:hypothetical protein